MTASTGSRWSTFGSILLLLALGPGGADAEQRRDSPAALDAGEPPAAEQTAMRVLPPPDDPRLAERARRLEEVVEPARRIRQIYQAFERAATLAGHPFELDVLEVETLPFAEFSSYAMIDMMSAPTGGWVEMHPMYFDANWMDQKKVIYELDWRERALRSERVVFQWIEELEGESFRQTLERELRQRRRERFPIAVTSYRARVRLGDHQRTYRAAGFWYDQDNGDFELEVLDYVVPRVSEALVESVKIASREELEEFQRGDPRFAAPQQPDTGRSPCTGARQPDQEGGDAAAKPGFRPIT
jgi:hypothetical protein